MGYSLDRKRWQTFSHAESILTDLGCVHFVHKKIYESENRGSWHYFASLHRLDRVGRPTPHGGVAFGAKEAFMVPMNSAIEPGIPLMADFLRRLAS